VRNFANFWVKGGENLRNEFCMQFCADLSQKFHTLFAVAWEDIFPALLNDDYQTLC